MGLAKPAASGVRLDLVLLAERGERKNQRLHATRVVVVDSSNKNNTIYKYTKPIRGEGGAAEA